MDLEAEIDHQVKEVEQRVKEKADADLAAEKKSIRELLKEEMDELNSHLKVRVCFVFQKKTSAVFFYTFFFFCRQMFQKVSLFFDCNLMSQPCMHVGSTGRIVAQSESQRLQS